MAFNKKQPVARISMDRLAAVTGGASVAPSTGIAGSGIQTAAARRARRVSLEPDLSRIRKCAIEETPKERKKRLAAKTANFSATIIARIVIIAAAVLYGWESYKMTGMMHKGIAMGIFVMAADLGRVTMKALEPGSK